MILILKLCYYWKYKTKEIFLKQIFFFKCDIFDNCFFFFNLIEKLREKNFVGFFIGNNGTIDGQGSFWWQKFHGGKLKYTRPYLIELMFSDTIQISNLTLLDSPSWNIHPVYSR